MFIDETSTEHAGDETPGGTRQPADTVAEWAPWNLVVSVRNAKAPPPVAVKTSPGPAWDIEQVLKAAHIICKPPKPVQFRDEQEMRIAYSLIYDVFRFKSVLDQAIEDTNFFEDFPEFAPHRHLLWLFLMDLARRRWAARPRPEAEQAARLLEKAGSPFQEVERLVWEQHVHLAAAIARIRIKNKAFSLSELLPPHLREEKISACVNKDTVTGWVNTFKAKKIAVLVKRLHELGYSYSGSKNLSPGEYRFDRVCPRFITLRPENSNVAQMDLVKEGIIVLQEREFCEGASTLCRVLRARELQGVVAQTHASSPRCSAYLAAQLRELAAVLRAAAPAAPTVPELGRLVVFGAGDKVSSYICALRSLGVEASPALQTDAAVCVLSEAVHADSPVVVDALQGVVAVLATPPNSYSAVSDPIDLVCGRGGDLAMLEILTESVIDQKGKERVHSILEEQKKTLKTLMSKPQIQIIMYETHSSLEAENQAQVMRAIEEANRLATERHSFLNKKPSKMMQPEIVPVSVPASRESTDDNMSTDRSKSVLKKPGMSDAAPATGSGKNKGRPIPGMKTADGAELVESVEEKIVVPNCDLFEVGKLPTLGNGLDLNFILDRDGCYLSLIQRKEVTRLDAKYMIQMAEERGLFGNTTAADSKKMKKKDSNSRVCAAPKKRRKKHTFVLERVAAPTCASLSRSARVAAEACVMTDAAAAAVVGCTNMQRTDEPGHVCARHLRRQLAYSAGTSAPYDPAHLAVVNGPVRSASRGLVGGGGAPSRHPFPVAVHDVKLISFHHAAGT